jgi:hypothetical protein
MSVAQGNISWWINSGAKTFFALVSSGLTRAFFWPFTISVESGGNYATRSCMSHNCFAFYGGILGEMN